MCRYQKFWVLMSMRNSIKYTNGTNPHYLLDNVLDYNIIVNKFELQLHNYVHIWINIIEKGIIIMLCRKHAYPWPSVATSPYRSSPLVGLQGHIPYPHIAAESMFKLVVLLLPGHMWGSIGVHHLWARPCFSSSDLHVWFI